MPFQICDITIALGSLKESNKKIEKSIGRKKGQIYKKTGIKQRFISKKYETTEFLAIKSLKKLAERNSFKNVKYLISVSNTPSIQFPSLAQNIYSELKLKKEIFCIGINAGCTGYVDALIIADKMLKKNEDIIVVTSDTYSKHIRKYDRSTRSLFSDGSSSTLLKYNRRGWKTKKTISSIKKNSANFLILHNFKKKTNYIEMNGAEVLSFAVKNVIPEINKILIKNKKTVLFAHQAGKIVFDIIKSRIPNKILTPSNFHKYGNLVSTSIPNLIKENFNVLKKNNQIILSGFGVGLASSHIFLSKN